MEREEKDAELLARLEQVRKERRNLKKQIAANGIPDEFYRYRYDPKRKKSIVELIFLTIGYLTAFFIIGFAACILINFPEILVLMVCCAPISFWLGQKFLGR